MAHQDVTGDFPNEPIPSPAPGWRDIATCPRDGTKVLMSVPFAGDTVCEDFTEVCIGFWDEGNALGDPESIWHREPDWDVPTIGEPTHWMPLPPPPTTEAGR